MTRLLVLYPGWWRQRYGVEMRALLELAPAGPRDRVDLARGAFDAWLHPPVPSHIPALAALLGGGLWTAVAAGVVIQPVPPDWPGYLQEVILLALVSVACLLVAVVGIALRAADARRRPMGLAVGFAVIWYLGWIVALGATAGNAVDGAALGATQAAAMIATAAVGAVLVRAGDGLVGPLVLVAAAAMLVPWATTWLVFGAVWTAIGIVLDSERRRRIGNRRGLA
jgi:hypothetical protein